MSAYFAYNKPVPAVDRISKPYWKGCAEGRLLVQKCTACNRLQFYPRPICKHCMSDSLEWVRCKGDGKVHTFSIVYQNAMPGFAEEVPYVLAVIELGEGVRITSNITGCRPEDVRIGMPVEVVFEKVDEEIGIPKFRPRGAA